MKMIIRLCVIIGINFSSMLLASSITEDELFGTKRNSTKIQGTNPQLWLHIKVDRYSFYKASAEAWVTRGESDQAAKVAVKELKISLRFESSQEKSVENHYEVQIQDNAKNRCYELAYASAESKGPDAHISTSVFLKEDEQN